jgi:hypothetical protein
MRNLTSVLEGAQRLGALVHVIAISLYGLISGTHMLPNETSRSPKAGSIGDIVQ